MLTPCINKPSNNFVVFELCDEIEIDSVVLANFEFFSSMFKLIKMSVSNSGLEGAAGTDWTHVGFLKTHNTRGLQVFAIKHLKGFYRYVRLDFLTHYGTEYYCPLSLVRIYGLTQLDAYRRDEKLQRRHQVQDGVDDHDEQELNLDHDRNLFATTPSDRHPHPRLIFSDSRLNDSEPMIPNLDQVDHTSDSSNLESHQASTQTSYPGNAPTSSAPHAESGSDVTNEKSGQGLDQPSHPSSDPVPPSTFGSIIPAKQSSHSDSKAPSEDESSHQPSTQPGSPQEPSSLTPHPTDSSAPHQASDPDSPPSSSPNPPKSVQQDEPASAPSEQQPPGARPDPIDRAAQSNPSTDSNQSSSINSIPVSNSTNHTSASREGKKMVVNPENLKVSTNLKSTYPEKPYPPTGSPTGQSSESIFGQIMKRLNSLESNHDLTLKYVEDQVKVLEASLHRLDERLVELDRIFKLQANKSRKMMNEFNRIRSKFSLERSFLNHRIESLDASITFIKRFGLIQFISILAILMFLCLTRFQHTPTPTPPSSEPLRRCSKKSRQAPKLRMTDQHSLHPLGLVRLRRKNSTTVFVTRAPGGSSSSRNSLTGRRRCRPRFGSPSNETEQAVGRKYDPTIVKSRREEDQDWLMHHNRDAREEEANHDDYIDPDLMNQGLKDDEHDLSDQGGSKVDPKLVEIPKVEVPKHDDVHPPESGMLFQADRKRPGSNVRFEASEGGADDTNQSTSLLPPSYRSTVLQSTSSSSSLPFSPCPSPTLPSLTLAATLPLTSRDTQLDSNRSIVDQDPSDRDRHLDLHPMQKIDLIDQPSGGLLLLEPRIAPHPDLTQPEDSHRICSTTTTTPPPSPPARALRITTGCSHPLAERAL